MYLQPKSKAIKNRRKEMGMTQIDVADAAGIGATSLHRMEKNLHLVHPFRAKAVADVLGCQVEDLFEEPEKSAS